MRIDAATAQSVFDGLCHQLIGIAGCVIKRPFDDAKAGTPTLPLPGGVSAESWIKLAEPNPGRFCAPRKEPFWHAAVARVQIRPFLARNSLLARHRGRDILTDMSPVVH